MKAASRAIRRSASAPRALELQRPDSGGHRRPSIRPDPIRVSRRRSALVREVRAGPADHQRTSSLTGGDRDSRDTIPVTCARTGGQSCHDSRPVTCARTGGLYRVRRFPESPTSSEGLTLLDSLMSAISGRPKDGLLHRRVQPLAAATRGKKPYFVGQPSPQAAAEKGPSTDAP